MKTAIRILGIVLLLIFLFRLGYFFYLGDFALSGLLKLLGDNLVILVTGLVAVDYGKPGT